VVQGAAFALRVALLKPWILTTRTRHFFNGNFRILNWRYLPYIRPMYGLCKVISPENMVLYGTVPPF
jgi:hypothetical protein